MCSCQRPTTSSSRPVQRKCAPARDLQRRQAGLSARLSYGQAQGRRQASAPPAAPRHPERCTSRLCAVQSSGVHGDVYARWSAWYGTDLCHLRRRTCRHRCAHRKAMPQRKRRARPAAKTWTPTWTRRSSAKRTRAPARGRPRPCWLPARPGTPAPPGALLRGCAVQPRAALTAGCVQQLSCALALGRGHTWVPLCVRRPFDFANLGTLIAQQTGTSGALLPASRRAPASTAGLQPA